MTGNNQKLAVSSLKGISYYEPSQIVRLEASSNYTRIYFKDNTRFVSSKVLKEFADELVPLGFIRPHRSHLVNPEYIISFERSGNIIMNDSSRIEVSRRRKAATYRLLSSG